MIFKKKVIEYLICFINKYLIKFLKLKLMKVLSNVLLRAEKRNTIQASNLFQFQNFCRFY